MTDHMEERRKFIHENGATELRVECLSHAAYFLIFDHRNSTFVRHCIPKDELKDITVELNNLLGGTNA